MKKSIFFSLYILCLSSVQLLAQATIYPAPAQAESIRIDGATIHIGNGESIENGTVVFDKGLITYVGTSDQAPEAQQTIDGQNKHLYPGFIAPHTNLGLVEIGAVKATVDFSEVGENNAHVRSIIAYNTDSKVIPTLRSNGILLAQITPMGGLISGSSSVVQLDAWNWEDAAYKIDDGIHLHWPTIPPNRSQFLSEKQLKEEKEKIKHKKEELVSFLQEAREYAEITADEKTTNARLEAFKDVFQKEKNLYLYAEKAKDIREAVLALTQEGITPVLVGAGDAHLVLDLLKQHEIPVILKQTHRLPENEEDDVYLPYRQAKKLHDAGILIAFGMDGFWQQRNLPFMAGTAVAYGLPYETAIQGLTLNTAKILGIEKKTGSIETGKDANFILTEGDPLDMRGNKLHTAYIGGREIDLDNLHKQLFERYNYKYEETK